MLQRRNKICSRAPPFLQFFALNDSRAAGRRFPPSVAEMPHPDAKNEGLRPAWAETAGASLAHLLTGLQNFAIPASRGPDIRPAKNALGGN
jgi:hypothetical protein